MAVNSDGPSKTQMDKLNNQLSFLPEKLLVRLMHFQKEGVMYAIKHDGRCLIGDEMGLGKTLQALSIAYYYRDEWPLLIVVPASLRYPWIDEVERWFPEIDPAQINLIQAGTDTAEIASARITVVTYGLLRCPSSVVLQEALLNQHFAVVIADESHNLKNRRSATSKYLVPLVQRAARRLLLTGTPALARPEELFPQIDSVLPGKFGSWTSFAKRYCNARWQHFGRQARRWVTDGASNLEELQGLLCNELMIRRLKKDVLTQLPPKQRQRVLFPLKESVLKKDMDLSWRELETAMGRGGMGAVFGGEATPEPGSSFEINGLISTIYRKTAAIKIGPVKEYVKMLCDNQGLKFIVFAHHHVMLDGVSELLHDEQVAFIRIDGNTEQQTRPHLVHEFQADKNIRVAVLSIKAAGVGLTLTAAKLVVFAELDWTPGVLEQCEDRAHRIGQQQTVHVHYLVAKGTMDEWVWCSLARKTTVVTTTLNGERQVLRMDDANQGQVACLANAEAWIPKAKSEMDPQSLASFFNTQQQASRKQRSIAEFFTPKAQKRKLMEETLDTGNHIQAGKKLREAMKDTDNSPTSPAVYLIESDSEGSDDFKISKGTTRKALITASSTMDGVKSKPKNVSSMWNCGVCTFLNHNTMPMCEMCSTRRPKVRKTMNNPKKKIKGIDKNTVNSTTQQSQKGNIRSSTQDPSDANDDDLDFDIGPQKNNIKASHRRSQKNTHEISDDDDDELPDLVTGSWRQADTEVTTMRDTGHCLLDGGSHGSSESLFDDCDDAMVNMSESDDGSAEVVGVSRDDKVHPSPPPSLPSESPPETLPRRKTGESGDLPDPGTGKPAGLPDPETGKLEDMPYPETGMPEGNLWICPQCESENSVTDTLCDVCLGNKPVTTSTTSTTSTPTTPTTPTTPRTETSGCAGTEGRVVDLDQVPVYERFQFCCSRNTSRVYLYDELGVSLDVNFTPLDVEMEIFAALPDLLLHPFNMRLVKRFLREWSSLAPTKRRLIVKSGQVFSNPLMHYEELRRGRVATKQRFTSKADMAAAAVSHAELVNGSVRALTRPRVAHTTTSSHTLKTQHATSPMGKSPRVPETGHRATTPAGTRDTTLVRRKGTLSGEPGDATPTMRRDAASKAQRVATPKGQRVVTSMSETGQAGSVDELEKAGKADRDCVMGEVILPETAEEIERMPGMVQALAADGTPLCVTCQKPYTNSLVCETTVRRNPWATRFCSQHCAEQLWTRRHGDYAKKQVFELEHGRCQICQFDAHKFFERIKVTRDVARRAELIQDSKYGLLSSEIKQQMARQPKKGQFWQADHIQAVSEGGGECDIDNLRTLCTPCHRDVTAEQAKRRVMERRQKKAAQCRDITAFFKPL